MSQKSFLLHQDSLVILEKMTDEQAGQFIKILYYFKKTGELQELDFAMEMATTPFLNQFKRDKIKYDNVCEARKLAGSKGGKQKVANASKCKQKVAKVAENDNDNDNDNKKEKEEELIIPNFISAENWNDFVSMRKKSKKALSSRAAKMIIKDLTDFESKREGNANLALENSIKSNWVGVFEPNFKNKKEESRLGWKN